MEFLRLLSFFWVFHFRTICFVLSRAIRYFFITFAKAKSWLRVRNVVSWSEIVWFLNLLFLNVTDANHRHGIRNPWRYPSNDANLYVESQRHNSVHPRWSCRCRKEQRHWYPSIDYYCAWHNHLFSTHRNFYINTSVAIFKKLQRKVYPIILVKKFYSQIYIPFDTLPIGASESVVDLLE